MAKDLDKKTLKKLYIKEKQSIDNIAKMYDRSYFGVRHACLKYGIKLYPVGVRRKIHVRQSDLKRLYLEQKLSLKQIANIFSCSPSTILNRCREYGIRLRSRKISRQKIERLTESRLRTLYVDKGKTIREIAAMLNCSYEPMRRKIRNLGIPLRNAGHKKVQIDEFVLYRLYTEDGKSMSKIAAIYNCSVSTISLRLKRFELKKKNMLDEK